MGLFHEADCVYCGQKTNVLMRTKIGDGNFICSKCRSYLPSFFADPKLVELYRTEEVRELLQWKKDSIHQFAGIYRETDSYGNLSMDIEHGLFTLERYRRGKTPVFQFADIVEYEFTFLPEQIEEGVFSSKVRGRCILDVEMRKPANGCVVVLADNEAAKAKESFFGKVTYEYPYGMVENAAEFCCAKLKYEDPDAEIYDLLKDAMAMYLVKDLNTMDSDKLDCMRIRLEENITQTGGGERQIRRINEAYQLLKGKVNE